MGCVADVENCNPDSHLEVTPEAALPAEAVLWKQPSSGPRAGSVACTGGNKELVPGQFVFTLSRTKVPRNPLLEREDATLETEDIL